MRHAPAENPLRDDVTNEVRRCCERGFELLDLCALDPQWQTWLKRLLRFRKISGEPSLDVSKDAPRFVVKRRNPMQ